MWQILFPYEIKGLKGPERALSPETSTKNGVEKTCQGLETKVLSVFPSHTVSMSSAETIKRTRNMWSIQCSVSHPCKTQNSGLRSKEEKPARPNKPVQQMQHARRFIDGCASWVTLISWEAEHTEQQIGQAFYRQKKHPISILHTGYKVIGYMFAKQSYWYKLRGLLFKLRQFYWYKRCGLLFKLRLPRAFQLSRGLLLGAY